MTEDPSPTAVSSLYTFAHAESSLQGLVTPTHCSLTPCLPTSMCPKWKPFNYFPLHSKIIFCKNLYLEQYNNRGQQESSSIKDVVTVPKDSGSSPEPMWRKERTTRCSLTSTHGVHTPAHKRSKCWCEKCRKETMKVSGLLPRC